jgi:hypothetical protein
MGDGHVTPNFWACGRAIAWGIIAEANKADKGMAWLVWVACSCDRKSSGDSNRDQSSDRMITPPRGAYAVCAIKFSEIHNAAIGYVRTIRVSKD